MTNNKPEINEELRDIVSTTIECVKEGLKGKNCGVVGQIEFEIAVIKTDEYLPHSRKRPFPLNRREYLQNIRGYIIFHPARPPPYPPQ